MSDQKAIETGQEAIELADSAHEAIRRLNNLTVQARLYPSQLYGVICKLSATTSDIAMLLMQFSRALDVQLDGHVLYVGEGEHRGHPVGAIKVAERALDDAVEQTGELTRLLQTVQEALVYVSVEE